MSEADREEYENVLILRNVVEADLMARLLEEAGITFFIRDWHDVNYDGVFVNQKGYGWLMGRKADEERIRSIYADRIGTGEDGLISWATYSG